MVPVRTVWQDVILNADHSDPAPSGGINKRVAVSSECWVCIFLLKGTGVVHHQHLVSREGGEIPTQLLAPGPVNKENRGISGGSLGAVSTLDFSGRASRDRIQL